MPDLTNAAAALSGHHRFRSNELHTPASRFYVALALHAFGNVAWRLPYLPEARFFEVTINITRIALNMRIYSHRCRNAADHRIPQSFEVHRRRATEWLRSVHASSPLCNLVLGGGGARSVSSLVELRRLLGAQGRDVDFGDQSSRQLLHNLKTIENNLEPQSRQGNDLVSKKIHL